MRDNDGNAINLNDYQVYYYNTKYGSTEYPEEDQYPIYNATTITKNANIVYDVTESTVDGKTVLDDVYIGEISIPY